MSMRERVRASLLGGVTLLAVQGGLAQETLQKRIEAIAREPAVSRVHWGVQVETLDGRPLVELNGAQLFHPESNAKLITTAAAFALLGAERTFETKVLGTFDPATGMVKGDLSLIGGGDASFGTDDLPYRRKETTAEKPTADLKRSGGPVQVADLNAMADQLVAKGVKVVTGDVVGDDSYFLYEPYPHSWAADDFVWGYGAPVSALAVGDNQVRLTILPGAKPLRAGEPMPGPEASLDQAVPYYMLKSTLQALPAKGAGTVRVERSGRTLNVYGGIAADAKLDVEQIAVADPTEYAAMILKASLESRGVRIVGKADVRHRTAWQAESSPSPQTGAGEGGANASVLNPEAAECSTSLLAANQATLASHTSAPLADDIVYTNKMSQNLHAEILLHHLGRLKTCALGSNVEGMGRVRAFLVDAGVEPDDFILYDGSGLSEHDLVTPRALARLLVYAARQSWFAAWKASLPVGGVDGTLAGRFTKAPLKGRVEAKTGSDSENRALSGYIESATGRTVVFSILATDHLPGGTADREAMDRMVAAIYAAE